MNTDGSAGPVDESTLDIADKWIIAKLNDAISEVTRDMDDLELGLATQKLYDFFWSEFCDWYIEMAKPRLYGENPDVKAATINVLVYVLRRALKLLHPFMPFITEEIYTSLPGSDETIMLSAWPKAEFEGHAREAGMMQEVMDMIRAVRNIRSEMDVPPKVKVKITVLTDNGEAISACADYIKKLAYASDVEVITDKSAVPANNVSVVSAIGEAFLPLSDLIDVDAEMTRIQKEIKDNASEIARAEGKLKNKGFVDKAPEAVIQEERDKLAKHTDMRAKLTDRLSFLEKMK